MAQLQIFKVVDQLQFVFDCIFAKLLIGAHLRACFASLAYCSTLFHCFLSPLRSVSYLLLV